MQRGIAAALFGVGLIAEPVVVVDDAAVDLAGVDGLHRGDVVVVDHRVGLHAGQPLRGGLLALELKQGGDDGLEVGLGRSPAPAALPRGLLQVQHGLRQLIGLQLGLVVDEDGAARRDARPLAGGRTVLRRNLIEGVGVEVGEQPGLLDGGHRGGVLGQEDVGGRRVALGDQLVAEFGVAALAVGHLDAGLLGEGVDPLLGQRLMLRVVDQQFVAVARTRAGGQCRARRQRSTRVRRSGSNGVASRRSFPRPAPLAEGYLTNIPFPPLVWCRAEIGFAFGCGGAVGTSAGRA